MEAIPGLQVTTPAQHPAAASGHSSGRAASRPFRGAPLASRLARTTEPAVFYDPRSLEPDGPGGVLHAKAVVADDEAAFVTSANLTEAAFDRNIEVGVLTRDHALAASLARHFGTLIEQGLLLPLPSR